MHIVNMLNVGKFQKKKQQRSYIVDWENVEVSLSLTQLHDSTVQEQSTYYFKNLFFRNLQNLQEAADMKSIISAEVTGLALQLYKKMESRVGVVILAKTIYG